MFQVILLAIMLAAAGLPFAALTWAMRRGKDGLVLTVVSVIGAAVAILWFAAGRPMGIDPVQAMTLALVFGVPALLGGTAGAVLGWLLRRRDDRRIS